MGFGYKDWSGVFYPVDLDARDYLSYYSRVFSAAEIDSTFYGIPKAETIQRWAQISPDDFKFCTKTPRTITHDLSLVGALGQMEEFIRAMRLLEHKLGVILLQFPPSFNASQITSLDHFLADLPSDVRYAVEVRHPSWYTGGTPTAAVLAKHGVAWAATEYPGLPGRIYKTSDFLYIRWIGQHGTFETHTHERIDRSTELERWWKLIQQNLEQVTELYGFFNNDYAGFAPATANRFKEIAGLPGEPLRPAAQPPLF